MVSMKIITLIRLMLALLLLAGGVNAIPIEEWNKTFGGTGSDEAYFVQQTTDGGYVIAGRYGYIFVSEYHTDISSDAWLIKTDANGNQLWSKIFGGTGSDGANSIQQTSDNGYIIAGLTYPYGMNSPDAWIIKLSSESGSNSVSTPTTTPTLTPTPTITETPTPTPTPTSTLIITETPTPVPTPTHTPTTTPIPTPRMPGFEGVLALIGVLTISYLKKREN